MLSKLNFLELNKGFKIFSPLNRKLVDLLHERNVDVYLVSGGFRKIIEPIAEVLNVCKTRVYANTLLFSEKGKVSTLFNKKFKICLSFSSFLFHFLCYIRRIFRF